jgi:hypothetical protein
MQLWTLKHRNINHNHPLESNPFNYMEHCKLHPGNEIAVIDATKHRGLKTSYRRYLRAQDPTARQLSKSEYYNLSYNRHSTNENQPKHIIERMMTAFGDAGFHVRLRWVELYSNDQLTHRLDQIFMVSDAQVAKARRFCSGFVIQMDATFNTNILKMPLCNIIGIDNHSKTLTAALSFIRAEAAEDFIFIFKCLDELVFYGEDFNSPRVLITDQSAGMIKALRETESWGGIIHQLCGWHMVQNIKTFIQRNRHTR